jgi:probable HAF family extracellular repeat protein
VRARDLGTLGGSNSLAWAITATGEIVGSSFIPGGRSEHAFLWTPARGMADLGTLGGRPSFATGINAKGQVVGQADIAQRNPNGSDITHAVLWYLADRPAINLSAVTPVVTFDPNGGTVPYSVSTTSGIASCTADGNPSRRAGSWRSAPIDKLKTLVQAMGGPRLGGLERHLWVRKRLDDVLGNPGSGPAVLAERLSIPWLVYEHVDRTSA